MNKESNDKMYTYDSTTAVYWTPVAVPIDVELCLWIGCFICNRLYRIYLYLFHLYTLSSLLILVLHAQFLENLNKMLLFFSLYLLYVSSNHSSSGLAFNAQNNSFILFILLYLHLIFQDCCLKIIFYRTYSL